MRVTCYLRQLRGDALLKDFAAQADINKGTLSAIEHGYRFPTDKQLPGLEAVYGIPMREAYPGHVAIELHADEERR